MKWLSSKLRKPKKGTVAQYTLFNGVRIFMEIFYVILFWTEQKLKYSSQAMAEIHTEINLLLASKNKCVISLLLSKNL